MRQDVKGTQRRCSRFWLSAIGLFLVIVGTAATPARGAAGTFRFVIQDVEGARRPGFRARLSFTRARILRED